MVSGSKPASRSQSSCGSSGSGRSKPGVVGVTASSGCAGTTTSASTNLPPGLSTAAMRRKRSRLPSASRWWTARHETTRSKGTFGQRVLEARNAEVSRDVGCGEHRLALVDSDEVRQRVGLEHALAGDPGADAELEDVVDVDRLRRPGGLLLELVEDGDVFSHVVDVGVRVEVELVCHCSILSAPTNRARLRSGRSRATGRAPSSHQTPFTRRTPSLRSKTGSIRPTIRSPRRIGST